MTPVNTLTTNALLFVAGAWTFVLGLTAWSFWRLMQTPREEKLPPPGTSL